MQKTHPEPILTNVNGRLELHLTGADAALTGALSVDFLSTQLQKRSHQGHARNELLARAVGIKSDHRPTVIDATAGLGRDAFILAVHGCKVTMLERSPIIAALLQDGLNRALATPELADKLDLNLIQTDAIEYLAQLTPAQYPEVVYLDPMHPPRNKSALVKKEMRMVRAVVGDNYDSDALLHAALHCAKQRVVVKRPRLAEPLAGMQPSFAHIGKQQRFDVYLCIEEKPKQL